MTLDPGHFHAALVQKKMYEQVSPAVHVYAPKGLDLQLHLERIEAFNSRPDDPTQWDLKIYAAPDYLGKMLSEKPGNVVVLAGNNQKKTEYIKKIVDAGLNVLSDKPMCIDKEGFGLLTAAFQSAEQNDVLLYDIMTERYEITTLLQKELVNKAAVFGEFLKGTPEDPSVTKESVHHLFKYVSGSPLRRPGWYFDVSQQGEGLVDVTTHLVDLTMWECFPEETIDYQTDIQLLSARRWSTPVNRPQYEKVTGLPEFPDYLRDDVQGDTLALFANGDMIYTLKGIHTKVSVIWNFEAPEGTGDTHLSIMKGTKSNIVIRQGAEQNYRPELYVEPAQGADSQELGDVLTQAVADLQASYPGIGLETQGPGWHIVIPDEYRVGHEAHFSEVTEKYLSFLKEGSMPGWEVPNMITKYYITTSALEMAKGLPE
ncbi:MAG: putative oxidoreductase C-terminal domain-containing protein [Acidobacteriota bacterium]